MGVGVVILQPHPPFQDYSLLSSKAFLPDPGLSANTGLLAGFCLEIPVVLYNAGDWYSVSCSGSVKN